MKLVALLVLLGLSGCAFSFGPPRPSVCNVYPDGKQRCFSSEEERRAWMSRDMRQRMLAHEANEKRRDAAARERVRLRAAAQQARDAADEVDLAEDEVFNLQVEMNEQARSMRGTAGASP